MLSQPQFFSFLSNTPSLSFCIWSSRHILQVPTLCLPLTAAPSPFPIRTYTLFRAAFHLSIIPPHPLPYPTLHPFCILRCTFPHRCATSLPFPCHPSATMCNLPSLIFLTTAAHYVPQLLHSQSSPHLSLLTPRSPTQGITSKRFILWLPVKRLRVSHCMECRNNSMVRAREEKENVITLGFCGVSRAESSSLCLF